MKKIGKKGQEWIRERAKLIKEAVLAGTIRLTDDGYIKGVCKDCGHWHNLNPDHRKKRSQGGKHTADNIDWICNEAPCFCHDKRDNQGDPMGKKDKSKKPVWMKRHECRYCNSQVSQYICPSCGKKSV